MSHLAGGIPRAGLSPTVQLCPGAAGMQGLWVALVLSLHPGCSRTRGSGLVEGKALTVAWGTSVTQPVQAACSMRLLLARCNGCEAMLVGMGVWWGAQGQEPGCSGLPVPLSSAPCPLPGPPLLWASAQGCAAPAAPSSLPLHFQPDLFLLLCSSAVAVFLPVKPAPAFFCAVVNAASSRSPVPAALRALHCCRWLRCPGQTLF